jgi:hypothetical protein
MRVVQAYLRQVHLPAERGGGSEIRRTGTCFSNVNSLISSCNKGGRTLQLLVALVCTGPPLRLLKSKLRQVPMTACIRYDICNQETNSTEPKTGIV